MNKNPFELNAALAAKVGSIVVHADCVSTVGYAARNAMPEIAELVDLQREAFNPETDVMRLMKIRQRIREIVGE